LSLLLSLRFFSLLTSLCSCLHISLLLSSIPSCLFSLLPP
jgi:hypothetical protein